jgi:Protein of unknown function (DUF3126)
MGRNSERIVPPARRVTAAPGCAPWGENMAARLASKALAPAGRFGQQDARFRGALPVDVQEIKKLDNYLKRLFGNPRIRVVPRPKKDDSAEVYIGEEFIGVLFLDDEDQDRSYNFQMAILETDLE